MLGAGASVDATKLQGPGSILYLCFCLFCSPMYKWVSSGFSSFHPLPKNMSCAWCPVMDWLDFHSHCSWDRFLKMNSCQSVICPVWPCFHQPVDVFKITDVTTSDFNPWANWFPTDHLLKLATSRHTRVSQSDGFGKGMTE